MKNRYHQGLLPLAKLLNVDTTPLTERWSAIYSKRVRTRGKADAVKFMKELNTAAERYALRQKIKLSSWTKLDKDGFPCVLGKHFRAYLRHEDNLHVVMALSVMRTVESLHLPISKDISSVTDPCKVDDDVMGEILNFIPSWVKRFKPLKLKQLKYHYTAKGGPNGPALAASGSDIVAVMRDPKLHEAIRVVEDKLGTDYPMPDRDEDELNIDVHVRHSRLTQFSEKAGKTRTIAIIDYFSQRCLKPLHKSLMALLHSLAADGTYSHMKVAEYAQQKTSEKTVIYCADLTAFTDRFPAEIQRVLLFELLKDDELSQALWTILADRTFELDWSGEEVRYQCGQPMGAYASWALCSLAHHLLVQFSAYKAGVKQCQSFYRLIGDDVIITERNMAIAYRKYILALGVEINSGKTVLSTPSSDYSGAEVAKQIYLNGKCLTPLTPGFIRDLKKPYMINSCMRTLDQRYQIISTGFPSMLINAYFPKGSKNRLSWLLASNPINGVIKPDFSGYNEKSVWASTNVEVAKDEYNKILITALEAKAQSSMEKLFSMVTASGGPWKDQTCDPQEVIDYVSYNIANNSMIAVSKLKTVNLDSDEDMQLLFEEVDFIPDPELPYQKRKNLRQKQLSLTIKTLYESIKSK